MAAVLLRRSQLSLDPRCQARTGFSEVHAEALADLLRRGVEFSENVVVFFDRPHYWVAHGHHRLRGYELAERGTLPVDVRRGTLRDAILYAAGVNQEEKLARSHEDKRRAVLLLLTDAVWGEPAVCPDCKGPVARGHGRQQCPACGARLWSNERVAGHCGVGESLVRVLRGELAADRAAELAANLAFKTPDSEVIARLAGRPAPADEPDPRARVLAALEKAEGLLAGLDEPRALELVRGAIAELSRPAA